MFLEHYNAVSVTIRFFLFLSLSLSISNNSGQNASFNVAVKFV